MWRSTGVEPGPEQRGESLGFDEKLAVRPDLVAEAKGGTAGGACVETVASQEGGDVVSAEGAPRPGAGRTSVRPCQRSGDCDVVGGRAHSASQFRPRRPSPSRTVDTQ